MNVDYLRKINNYYNSSSKKETDLFLVKNEISKHFSDTIDCYKIKLNNVEQDLLIIKTKDENIKSIKARPNEDFEVGDCIYWENHYWIVISKDLANQVYTSGKMQYCNYTLTFQHKKTGEILSYPCIKQTPSSATGIDEGNVISVGNAVCTIKLPFDEVTKLIDVDDRFFIDDLSVDNPQVYAVSKPDRVSYRYGGKGIIELVMKMDQYNSKIDDKELGICGKKETSTPPPEGSTYSVIGVNNDFYLGYPFIVTAIPYNSDGTVNEGVELVLNIVLPNGLEHLFTINYELNTCTITTRKGLHELIDKDIVINVDDGNGGYIGSQTFTITTL